MRYHQRFRHRLKISVGLMILVLCAGWAGFWISGEQTKYTHEALRSRIENLERTKETLEKTVTELRAQATTATIRFEQLQKTYQKIIPEGPMQGLVDLMRKQLEDGIDPNRLAFVVRSARPPQNCTDPETKRLVVSSPAYTGAKSRISIADGAIIITGDGESARNTRGAAEAWYDPSKKVAITFSVNGEKEEEKGVMPLHHSIVVGTREYRFTIEEGAKSFARITFDSCDYP